MALVTFAVFNTTAALHVTVAQKLYWAVSSDAATGDDFEVEINGVALADSGAIGGTAFGACVVAVTDTWLADCDMHITAQSGDLNPACMPAITGLTNKSDIIQFKLTRDVSFVTANCAEFQLIGVELEYNTDAATSAG